VTPGMLASNVETSGGTNITAHRYSGGLLEWDVRVRLA
jgi:hypothetical protein